MLAHICVVNYKWILFINRNVRHVRFDWTTRNPWAYRRVQAPSCLECGCSASLYFLSADFYFWGCSLFWGKIARIIQNSSNEFPPKMLERRSQLYVLARGWIPLGTFSCFTYTALTHSLLPLICTVAVAMASEHVGGRLSSFQLEYGRRKPWVCFAFLFRNCHFPPRYSLGTLFWPSNTSLWAKAYLKLPSEDRKWGLEIRS